MAKKKWTPEEKAAWEAQRAKWAEQSREFAEVVARYDAYLREQKERRERRRALARRLFPPLRLLNR